VLPEDRHATALIALFVILFLPVLLASVGGALGLVRRKREPRADGMRALSGVLQQLVLLGALAVTMHEGWWSWASIGVGPRLESALIGVLAYAGYKLAHDRYQLWAATRSPAPRDPKEWVTGLARFWPRVRWGKALVVLTLALNGVTEEIVTRGIFVHTLGRVSGSLAIGVAFGLLVNVVMHAYQGFRTLVPHAVFYAISVVLMESPYGLLAAIALHVCADLAHADGRKTLAYVRAVRRMRPAPAG